jgi:O-antigen/teichoic acid export membrane protein
MRIHLPTITQFAALSAFNITNALFQLLLIPYLVAYAGGEKLGIYFVVLSFTLLGSIVINFGTSQTSVIDLRKATSDHEKKAIITGSLQTRVLPFITVLLITIALGLFTNKGTYFLCGILILVSELINPQFYLVAHYKMNSYALTNFIFKTVTLVFLYQIRESSDLIELTLFTIGLIGILQNIFFIPYQSIIKPLFNMRAIILSFKSTFKSNGLIVGNGLTAQLQQALFLFVLPMFATPIFLSAYGFVDKLISSFRLLVNAYSTAIVPHASTIHSIGLVTWKALKKRQNTLLAGISIIAGLVMFYFPKELLTLLLLGKTKEVQFIQEAATLIKLTSPVPLLIAMNLFNVAEMILEKRFQMYFTASILTLSATILYIFSSYLGLLTIHPGYYLGYIELVCLLIYTMAIKKIRNEKKL